MKLNNLWGFFKESNSSLYALNSWQFPIPAGNIYYFIPSFVLTLLSFFSGTINKSIAGYIIGQASSLPITVAHARCENIIRNCQLNTVLNLVSKSNSSCGLLSERSYHFSFTNIGTSSTNKASIQIIINK